MRLPAFKKLNENLALFLVNNNFHKRTLTAIILGSITIYTMYSSNFLSSILVSLTYFGCMIEWLKIIFTSNKRNSLKFVWLLSGTIFISTGAHFLFKICQYNSRHLLLLCSVIWASDIGAYITGNLFKGPKLIPRISPNKTWSGAIGGLIFSVIIGMLIINHYFDQNPFLAVTGNNFTNIIFLVTIVMIGQIGDLIESYAKRCFNIRDSSQIIPGHGGILDRCDSIIAVGVGLSILSFNYL